jgi:hypothetical protein
VRLVRRLFQVKGHAGTPTVVPPRDASQRTLART